jgi:AraC-like DNA-binding protein
MQRPVARYREFVPCPALQADVYSIFSFTPEPAPPPPPRAMRREIAFDGGQPCAPQFADGHVSLTFELGQTLDTDGRWHADSRLRGTVIGPLTAVGRTRPGDLPRTIGVFFRSGRAAPFLRVAIAHLTDRAIAIEDVWGTAGSRITHELGELDEAARIDRVESVLLARLAAGRERGGALDVEGLAASVDGRHGRMTVDAMAHAAGVSRQYLSRAFRERIGITPKLYGRLARFQSGLVYAGARAAVDWSCAALDGGYADQSHMIAEFREFSGLTPQALAARNWFHPFIERAKSRRTLPLLRQRAHRGHFG